ncbi:MAG: YtxH domain-containing protein [Terrimesophilobacter sp.]
MRGKLVLLTGVAIGYVLGARAGRERYEEIKRAAGRIWSDPRVQHQVQNVEDFAKDKAPDVVDYLSEGAKKVVQRKSSTGRSSAGASGAKNSVTRKPATKQPAPKSGTASAKK